MTPTGAHLEEALESMIEAHLLANRSHQGANTSYDRDLALDAVELFTFIGATQSKAWDKLIARHGSDQATAQRKFQGALGGRAEPARCDRRVAPWGHGPRPA